MTAVLDHLWQSTVFAALAGALTLLLRNNGARIRYWVWFAASLKFLFPFAWVVAMGSYLSQLFAPSLNTPTILEFAAQPFATSSSAFPDFTAILTVAWGLGFVTVAGFWLLRWLRLRLVVRGAINLSLAAPIPVKSTAALLEPGLVGIWRSVLVLPEGIAERLSAGEMRAILAHELCHLRHRDNLTAAFHMLVEALFWFYPLVWWLGARLIAERERSCDEAVLDEGIEPKTYVEGIVKVCKFYLQSPLACASGVSGADLTKRMEMIMKNEAAIRLNKFKKAALGAAATLAIAFPLAAGLLTSPLSLGNSHAETSSCGKYLKPIKVKPLPPYPAASQKAKEEGTAILQVVVGRDGTPVASNTIKSSGFARLDDASIQWIKEVMRWAPLPQGCRSVTTRTKVVWSLKDIPQTMPAIRKRSPTP